MTTQSTNEAERFPTTPFFIMGCPRSGTTLVSRIVDRHSAIAVYHESQYYPIFRPALDYYGDLADRRNLSTFLADVRESIRLQGVEPPAVEEIFEALERSSFPGVLEAVLAIYARSHGKRRGGDKTPAHYAFLDEIRSGFPKSPILFVIRDPRDTVLSMHKTFRTPVADGARMWLSAYQSYASNGSAVHLVSYERLTENPEAVTRALCEFLGESYEAEMLQFFEGVPERIATRAHLAKVQGPVDAGSVGGYRELPATDIAIIESLCAEGMQALGYERATDATPQILASYRPGLVVRIRERLLYYGTDRERWRRGLFRWKIQFKGWLRQFLALNH